MDSSLFYCKSDEAYIIKTLAEVLQNILTDVCFEFTKDGIKLLTIDQKTPPNLMVHLELKRDKFGSYFCKKLLSIGINLQHFHKMIKSIKKKDHISLCIPSDKTNILSISTSQTENGPVVKSDIKIQKLQKLEIDLPGGGAIKYGHPIIIPTANFQKLCKDMNSISKVINIFSQESYLCFSSEIDGLYSRFVPFGEKPENSTAEIYEDTFITKVLNNLLKISGLNSKLRVYVKTGLPLKLSIDAGSLGILDIFIKSKKQIEEES